MEKCAEKTKWQSMTISAKKMFWPNSTVASRADKVLPRCSEMNSQTFVKSKGITLNSGSPTGQRLVSCEPDTVSLFSEELIRPSMSDSMNASQFPPPEEVVTETIPMRNPSFTPPIGDRKRTLMRYVAAVEELKDALAIRRPGWETFEFPEFDIIPESDGSL